MGKRSKTKWNPRAKGFLVQDWRAIGRVTDWGELSVVPRVLVRERSGTFREFVLWFVGYEPDSFLVELTNTSVSNLFMTKGQTRYCELIRGPHVKK